MSVATLSRALYLFHTFPFILTEIRDQWHRRWLRAALIIVAWVALAAGVPLLTSMQRLYSPEVIPSVVITKGGTGYLGSRHLQSQFIARDNEPPFVEMAGPRRLDGDDSA